TSDQQAKVLRVCEVSAQLGAGVACPYRDSLSNTIVGQDGTTVQFTCPTVRDGSGTSGGFSLYEAPVLGSASQGKPISCSRN
ncbi:MAG TPA: hypothetical protein VFP40_07910, partial [Terriglobales bacterium]|nr:hypothetical protein [Terriglobales bacterium]